MRRVRCGMVGSANRRRQPTYRSCLCLWKINLSPTCLLLSALCGFAREEPSDSFSRQNELGEPFDCALSACFAPLRENSLLSLPPLRLDRFGNLFLAAQYTA